MRSFADCFATGSIVVVSGLVDRNGVNPKDRPCVVIASQDGPDGLSYLVPIYGLNPGPVPPNHVSLPWRGSPRPHPVTGLHKPSGADCGDYIAVPNHQIKATKSTVPPMRMLEIAATVKDIQDSP